eukprot:TRINITY_DN7500_c0_g1_i1.p1 TRINITY_DN7500_c0_g1~~TRINITY_DN7500_c0_g1_i1.p1  ORF type:complete len:414 (-),score=97.18 TRINITY_DN7500_c0_g1_i1:64-1305(-)
MLGVVCIVLMVLVVVGMVGWLVGVLEEERLLKFVLRIRLVQADESNWWKVKSVKDIVASNSKLEAWNLKSYESNRVAFLLSQIEQTYHDEDYLNNKPFKWRIGFLYNLEQIHKHEFCSKASLLPYIQTVTRSIICSFDRTTEDLEVVTAHCNASFQALEKEAPRPLSEIDTLISPSGSLDMERFVALFDKQVVVNFNNLVKLSSLFSDSLIPKLKIINAAIKDASAFNLNIEWNRKKLSSLKVKLEKIATTLTEMLAYLKERIHFISHILENFPLDTFSPDLLNYLSKHNQELISIFEQDTPLFPIEVIHVGALKETKVSIRNEDEYQKMKNNYEELLIQVQNIRTHHPTSYPHFYPNLSTYDGEPYLRVENENHFCLLMSSYSSYWKKLNSLKKELEGHLTDMTLLDMEGLS